MNSKSFMLACAAGLVSLGIAACCDTAYMLADVEPDPDLTSPASVKHLGIETKRPGNWSADTSDKELLSIASPGGAVDISLLPGEGSYTSKDLDSTLDEFVDTISALADPVGGGSCTQRGDTKMRIGKEETTGRSCKLKIEMFGEKEESTLSVGHGDGVLVLSVVSVKHAKKMEPAIKLVLENVSRKK